MNHCNVNTKNIAENDFNEFILDITDEIHDMWQFCKGRKLTDNEKMQLTSLLATFFANKKI